MNLLQIAFRNLGRNRSRTMLSIIAVAVGVFVVILSKGVIDGQLESFLGNTIKLATGHVRIIDKQYEVKERLMSLNYPVDGIEGEGYEQMIADLESLDSVEYVVPRLKFGTMVSGKEEIQGVVGMGVEPASADRLVNYSRYLTEGRFISSGEREVVMGQKMLNKLGVKVGEKFTLVFNTAFGSLKGYTFTVVGALESGLQYLDDGAMFLPLDVAQDMLDMGPAVTELLVLAPNQGETAAALKSINGYLGSQGASERYAAVPWYKSSGMIETITMARMAYNFVYLFILFLASFVVINTMIMIVNERKKEIGMMSALGLKPKQILRLFIYEGTITGIIGSFVGVVFGSILVKVLSTVGIQMPSMEGLDPEIMLAPKLYPVFNAEVVIFSFVAGIFVTLLAVYGPAREAGKMEPTEALRA